MIKHFCDCCGEEQHERMYPVRLMKHIVKHLSGGHVKIMKDGRVEPISGVEVNFDLCITCYNKIMYKFWDDNKQNLKYEEEV